MDTDQLQKKHYDKIAHKYTAHYGDDSSGSYREKFFYPPLFQGVDLEGKRVLEAMCGCGETTPYLTERKALVTGLDISPEEIEMYQKRWHGCEAICASIFDSELPREHFDLVVIIGGLHHVQPNVEKAVEKIHSVLKPGGLFCFVEPHKGSAPDLVRKWWYRSDHYFESNEEAIDIQALHEVFIGRFKPVSEVYGGNVAYLLVLNSMILRIPLALKRFYTPVFLILEKMIQPLQGRHFSCYIAAQWRKTG
jgi:SAM-dependent methyltransferase